MKKLLFTVLMSFSLMMMGCTDHTCRLEKQWMDVLKVYENLSEDEFKAITKLDVSCCDKINALSEEDYAFYVTELVKGVFYFSQVDLLIEGQSEGEVQDACKMLYLIDECRSIRKIVSAIHMQTDSDEEKTILQEIQSRLK